jgi:hypothetical protein
VSDWTAVCGCDNFGVTVSDWTAHQLIRFVLGLIRLYDVLYDVTGSNMCPETDLVHSSVRDPGDNSNLYPPGPTRNSLLLRVSTRVYNSSMDFKPKSAGTDEFGIIGAVNCPGVPSANAMEMTPSVLHMLAPLPTP